VVGDGCNSTIKYREVTQKLKTLGCEELPRWGGGSQRKWFYPDTQKARVNWTPQALDDLEVI